MTERSTDVQRIIGFLHRNPKYKKILQKTYGRGFPVPSKIIDDFIKNSVNKAPKSKNLVFVGTPRLKNEAILLKKLLDKSKRIFFAVYIYLPDKVIFKRSFNRNRENYDLDKHFIKNRINYHKKQVKETVKYFQKFKKLLNSHISQICFQLFIFYKQINFDLLRCSNSFLVIYPH